MIEVIRPRGNGINHKYVIYEPGDIRPQGFMYVSFRNIANANPGSYVEDVNGRWVPLLRRITIDKARNRVNFIFPGFCYQPWKHELFSYPIDNLKYVLPNGLRPQHVALAKLIASGIGMQEAARIIYPKVKKSRQKFLLTALFHNNLFVGYILEEMGMRSKLKEALEARQLNPERVADEIENILTTKEAHHSLKKWALETIVAVYENPRTDVPIGPPGVASVIEEAKESAVAAIMSRAETKLIGPDLASGSSLERSEGD